MPTAPDDESIPNGSRWLEVETRRVIVIIQPGPSSPWWRYEDDPQKEWHYCDSYDFFLWGRFTRVS
jgi:hypothetical protein